MKSVFAVSLGLASIAAVAAGCTDQGTQPSTATESQLATTCGEPVFPKAWSLDHAKLVPTGVRNMTLVFTGTNDPRDAGSFYVWGVADARAVVWAYKANTKQYSDIMKEFGDEAEKVMDVSLEFTWGAGGTLGTGGPGPIGPGGTPPDFLERVVKTGSAINDTIDATLRFR